MSTVSGTEKNLLVTISEAAQMLSLSERKVRGLVVDGELRCVHIGRSVRFAVEDLRRFIAERQADEPKFSDKDDDR